MWYLWQFETAEGLTVTRGRDRLEALYYLQHVAKHTEIKYVDSTWIEAAWLYSINHPFNWLDNPPRWIADHVYLPADENFKKQFHPPLERNHDNC